MLETNKLRYLQGDVAAAPLNEQIDKDGVRVISITSGKGGVGKSNITVNLALALKRLGKKVLVLDGDFSLANLDILMDLKIKANLSDVIYDNKSLDEIIVRTKFGIDIIPSGSGLLEMTSLALEQRELLLTCIQGLGNNYDYLLIDTAAGVNDDVIWLNSSAGEVLVVATPEPTSIADSYALMKVLAQTQRVQKFKLLVNQVRNPVEGLKVYTSLSTVSDQFLNIGIDYLGYVEMDSNVSKAVRSQDPILNRFPKSAASMNLSMLGRKLVNEKPANNALGNIQFFWERLVANA